LRERGEALVTTGKRRFVAILVAAVAAGSVCLQPSASSAEPPLVTSVLNVCPDSTWRSEGEVFQIGVCVSAEITDLMGYNVAVRFDSTVIEILGVMEGPLPQSAPGNTFFWWFNPGVRSDSVHVNGAILEATVDGPGELLTMVFRARTHGVLRTTTVRIAHSELRDGTNHPIAHETVDGFVTVVPPTGIGPPAAGDFRLECRPNPFTSSRAATLTLTRSVVISARETACVRIYRADGRLVKTLAEDSPGSDGPGETRFIWDGTNAKGEGVKSGVYFAAATTPARIAWTKVVLIR
jgi:hypothetical protein